MNSSRITVFVSQHAMLLFWVWTEAACPWYTDFRWIHEGTSRIVVLKVSGEFLSVHQRAQPGKISIQTLHCESPPRTMSSLCPGQTREDGRHWPFPVRSCQTATAGPAAAMARLRNGLYESGGPGKPERSRATESPVRTRSRVYGCLLRRRSGGGGSSSQTGSWHKPR